MMNIHPWIPTVRDEVHFTAQLSNWSEFISQFSTAEGYTGRPLFPAFPVLLPACLPTFPFVPPCLWSLGFIVLYTCYTLASGVVILFHFTFSNSAIKWLCLLCSPPPRISSPPPMVFLWWDFLSEGILWSCSLFPNKFPWFLKSGFNQHNHSLFSDINSALICSCNSLCVLHLSGCFIYTLKCIYMCIYYT